MFDTNPSELAMRCDGRIDVFTRVEDKGQKRARFRCIAMIKGEGDAAQCIDLEPQAKRNTAEIMQRASQQLKDPVLAKTFAFNDLTLWPTAKDARDPLQVFLYHEFFRAWQVADLTALQFEARLNRDAKLVTLEPGSLAGAVTPIYDYNRLDRGVAIARILIPLLHVKITDPSFRDDQSGGTGYGLRMLGDLCLRAEENALALNCFETALAAGENPFRRRKAIEAAAAARDADRLAHHSQAYRAQWPLPADLAALCASGAA